MSTLIGSTGFVGSHLSNKHSFDIKVHKPNINLIKNSENDLLICAGLPAEKYKANEHSILDWKNLCVLADVLATVKAENAVLISTVDVFNPPIGVTEGCKPNLFGEPYGSHRAWFEIFFKNSFKNATIIRLPGLFAPDVRKNLIHDLLNKKINHLDKVNAESTFQFFDVRLTWEFIEFALENNIKELNVASEPLAAQQVADLFGVTLKGTASPVKYDMRTIYAKNQNENSGYFFDSATVLNQISSIIS